jgi:signal transduction histidine kinase
MKHNLVVFSRQYQARLRKHLKQGPRCGLRAAHELGRQAVAAGLETLDLARIHELALAALALPSNSAASRNGMTKQAKSFFAEVIIPIEKTHRAAQKASIHLSQLNETLNQRTVALADTNRRLKQAIDTRHVLEATFKKGEQHYSHLLKESHHVQEQLRQLTRQLLSAQEEERKETSRELRDEIAQTLLAIDVRLVTLKKEATPNMTGFEKDLASLNRLRKGR